MSNKVFISCAVTGSGDTASKHPDLPKTPEHIATASIEAAKAGAAIAHIHVREEDGTPSRRLELYKEVVDRVRSSDTDVILNLTTGMGGDLDIGQYQDHPPYLLLNSRLHQCRLIELYLQLLYITLIFCLEFHLPP